MTDPDNPTPTDPPQWTRPVYTGPEQATIQPRYAPQPKRGLSTGAIIAIVAGALVALLIVAGAAVAVLAPADEPDPAAAPAAETTPEATPEPVETTPEPIDPDDAIRDTADYRLATRFLDQAFAGSGANLDIICVTYGTNPAKYDAKFIRIATKNGLFSYETASVAVHDWFTNKCGT